MPLLFLIYINDLSNGIASVCKTCADDASLLFNGNENRPVNGRCWLTLTQINKRENSVSPTSTKKQIIHD